MNPKAKIPRPEAKRTDAPDVQDAPDAPDAEATLKISSAVVANVASTVLADPDRTSEVDVRDILEEVETLDAADVLEDEPIAAADLPTTRMPALPDPRSRMDSTAPVSLTAPVPTRANEPTRIIHRHVMTDVRRALTTQRARSVLMLAAALGTWGFFASFAIVGTYGAFEMFGHAHSASASAVAASNPASNVVAASPAIDSASSITPSADANDTPVAPLLYSESATSSVAPVAASESHAAIISSSEIFRRPSKTQVGVLRVPSSVNGLLIDGSPQRVTGGALILACGDHRIRPPHQSARVVRVPCGKTVTL